MHPPSCLLKQHARIFALTLVTVRTVVVVLEEGVGKKKKQTERETHTHREKEAQFLSRLQVNSDHLSVCVPAPSEAKRD